MPLSERTGDILFPAFHSNALLSNRCWRNRSDCKHDKGCVA